jgi:drug/metabolite transporter (DMT)-like permease
LAAAVLVLRETPLMWHLAGGALVVAGVWMAVSEPRPAVAAAPALARPRFGSQREFLHPRPLQPAPLGRR